MLALFIMTMTRIQYFNMDCFAEPDKHAQLLAMDAGMVTFFLRSVTSPALVCFLVVACIFLRKINRRGVLNKNKQVAMAVGMKKIVSLSIDVYNPDIYGYAWLLCGSCFVALTGLVVTFETHRFAYHRTFRYKESLFGISIATIFFLWPWESIQSFVLLGLVLATWSISVVVQYFVDDYFDRAWHRLPRTQTKSTASGLRRVPTALDLADKKYRQVVTSIRSLLPLRKMSAPAGVESPTDIESSRESSNPTFQATSGA